MKTNVDYIIVGQGLCGTWLSYYLTKEVKKVLVIDKSQPYSATKVASGIINPVTGRRIVRTWRIEELLPFSIKAYKAFGNEMNVDLMKETNIIDFHPTLQMRDAFENRLQEEPEYLHSVNDEEYKSYFNYNYGAGKVSPCLLIDLQTMLSEWRNKLLAAESLLEESFSWNDITIHNDYVQYKDIVAQKIICCEGVVGFDNPYFKNLPYSHMKGEAIIASIQGLPNNSIYKHGLSIVPWKDNLFWVGSNYEWKFDHTNPTAAFKQKVENFFTNFLKIPFTIVDHIAADRPTNMERRPFVGLHPIHSSVGILNGMGTKGCSLAPFFAHQLSNHLLSGSEIYADADVKRFEKILNREMK